jgi:hypothetical protein
MSPHFQHQQIVPLLDSQRNLDHLHYPPNQADQKKNLLFAHQKQTPLWPLTHKLGYNSVSPQRIARAIRKTLQVQSHKTSIASSNLVYIIWITKEPP